MGISLKGIAGFAPYAADVVARKQAREDADRKAALAEMARIQAANRQQVVDTMAYEKHGADIAHTNAETKNLLSPPEKPGDYDIKETPDGYARIPRQGPVGVVMGPDGQPLRPRVAAVPQQHVVDPVTGEVKFFDPTKPPAGLKVNPAPKAPPQNSFTPFQGIDPTTGAPVVRPFNTKTGEFGPPANVAPKGAAAVAGKALAGPIAAKVGQAGEMIKKAADVIPMIEGMNVSLSQSASADIASHGIGIGGLRVPGTKGLGNAMLNKSPGYAQYQAALQPFILAAAHALSGARINQDQVEQIRKSIEIAPGDVGNPQVVEQKRKNMLDLINSIAGSLPADAIAAQEGQMDAKALSVLEGHGYRRAAVSHAAPSSSASGTPNPAPSSSDPEFDALMAKVKRPGGKP